MPWRARARTCEALIGVLGLAWARSRPGSPRVLRALRLPYGGPTAMTVALVLLDMTFSASSDSAIIPDALVWLEHVQQPCSNLGKDAETLGKPCGRKYEYLQVICTI